MKTGSANIKTNVDHYDKVYSSVNISEILEKVRNFESFLENAIKTDTSWHGFYHGGFEKIIVGKTVLEIGCGNGLNSLIMASLGATVVANDISTKSMEIISSVAKELDIDNISTVAGDFRDMPFDVNSFDFVVGKAFLHHLTHELEDEFLAKAATILKPSGEARFFEPAVNSLLLDKIRWIIPLPGRPSILMRKKFAKWKSNDPHPDRDNSTAHYLAAGLKHFGNVNVIHIGSIERLCRLIPLGKFNRSYRRWAHRIEEYLPKFFRSMAARSQLLVFHVPR